LPKKFEKELQSFKEEKKMNGFFTAVKENASFVGVCLVTVLAITLIAYGIEKAAKSKNSDKDRVLVTRKIVMIGMFGAISGILYCFDFALPIAPNFYKLDFSELPALIAGFAFGPVAGVLGGFIKQLVKRLRRTPVMDASTYKGRIIDIDHLESAFDESDFHDNIQKY